jgi:hypothetical protein
MPKLRARQKIEMFQREALAVSRGSWKVGQRRFETVAVALLAERLLAIEEALSKPPPTAAQNGRRKKRPPTPWQKFFAAGMKAGKSPAEIGQEWQAKKGGS